MFSYFHTPSLSVVSSLVYRPALRPTQVLGPGRDVDYPPSSVEVGTSGAMHSRPL